MTSLLVFPAQKFENLRHERQLADGVGHVVDAQLNNRPVPVKGHRSLNKSII